MNTLSCCLSRERFFLVGFSVSCCIGFVFVFRPFFFFFSFHFDSYPTPYLITLFRLLTITSARIYLSVFVLSDTYLLLRLLAFSVHVPLPSSLFLMMCGTGCRMSPRSSLVRPFFCLLLLHFHSSIRSSISPAPAKGRRFLPPLSHFFFFFLEKYTLVVLYTHPPVRLKPASLLVVRRRLIYFWKGFCAPYRFPFPSPSVPWRVSFRFVCFC